MARGSIRCPNCKGGRAVCYYHGRREHGRRDGLPRFELTERERLLKANVPLSIDLNDQRKDRPAERPIGPSCPVYFRR